MLHLTSTVEYIQVIYMVPKAAMIQNLWRVPPAVPLNGGKFYWSNALKQLLNVIICDAICQVCDLPAACSSHQRAAGCIAHSMQATTSG